MKSCQLIKRQRVSLGVTQSNLSTYLGWTSPQFVSNIERNKCLLPIEKIKACSEILVLNPKELAAAVRADLIAEIDSEIQGVLNG